MNVPEPDFAQPTRATLRTWRVDNAVRVFGLALVVGTLLGRGSLGEAIPLLAALCVIAFIGSALPWVRPIVPGARWHAVVESLLVAIMLASSPQQSALLVYLAVPPIVAGLRHGTVSALNSGFVGATAFAVTLAVTPGRPFHDIVEAAPWCAVGLGMGLLASWQSRAVRDAVARQAADATAHDLVSQLHALAQRENVGLDRTTVVTELQAALRHASGTDRIAVYLGEGAGTAPSAPACSHGDVRGFDAYAGAGAPPVPDGLTVVTLRSIDEVVGRVVLALPDGWSPGCAGRVQGLADDFALRLSTAALFERVRLMATAEERDRIARDMHDGVAQELVALGYLADEIGLTSTEPEVLSLAGTLHSEVTRVVTELRFSIFDLRHHLADATLSVTLSEYVRQLAQDCDFQVNLVMDVSGPPLSPRKETELLRIAQQAIGNVRKHAQARSVWVTLVTDGTEILLHIEDDGVGNAVPKRQHWGLQSMRERAELIGATLQIGPRDGGGTSVLLRSGAPAPSVPASPDSAIVAALAGAAEGSPS